MKVNLRNLPRASLVHFVEVHAFESLEIAVRTGIKIKWQTQLINSYPVSLERN
jgi:hypothetical protein